MSTKSESPARCAVIVGPYTGGKTTLMEAMLFQAGAIHRKGSITEGNTVGDGSPEARARQMSVETNVASCEYLDDSWTLLDCPGSVEFSRDSQTALMAADVAIVVTPPELDRVLGLAPIFKYLDDYNIPHAVFVNKMDKCAIRIRDLMEALQSTSDRPLVLRQVPIRDGEDVNGFVDLVSERAWKYNPDKQSDLIEMPDSVAEREEEARQEMLESLADFDDSLLEQLLEDKIPATEEVYGYLSENLASDRIVPVLLGSADSGNGITRLWKVLRHEAPGPEVAKERLSIPDGEGFVASVTKTFHAAHMGKLSLVRVWSGELSEGLTLGHDRLSGLFRLRGQEHDKISSAAAGDVVALARMEELQTGDLFSEGGKIECEDYLWPPAITLVYALAVTPKNRQDEVKLTASLAKLIEEDDSLSLEHNHDTGEMLLRGQGEIHLKIAAERLKSKYNVDVEVSPPQTAYKETIRRSTTQHSRFKKQSGGHGQFGDVQVEIKPLPRGSGFEFVDKVVGGAIPRQYIPSVEHGAKEYLRRGPLGFPVVDVSVTLFDGQHHAVDSSDQAFRVAGRMAMSEGMPECQPVLLEPIYEVTVSVPTEFTNKVHSLISGRRGQILGFEMRPGWKGWDEVRAQLPQAELQDLIIELRSLTQGVGSFKSQFDHLQEFTGKLAERVIASRKEGSATH